jgi:RNA polymerase sigma-70 factor (ECF subfamily)
MSTEMEPSGGKAEDAALPSRDVLGTLVQKHREFLGFLERRVGNRSVAEDILQDAFVKSLDKLEALRDDESVVAWFYRTLRNAAIDYHRRRHTSEKALAQFFDELDKFAEPTVETRAAVCQCVMGLASTLKPEYAEALERIEVQGLSVKAFAEEAGISASNAAVRVFRAREALRKQVTKSCGTCAEHGCLDCTCGGGNSHSCSTG